jgi:hypothetical protein
VNDPQGLGRDTRPRPVCCWETSFICPVLPQKTHLHCRGCHRFGALRKLSISYPSVPSIALTGGSLVFVVARRPATTFYPRRRKSRRPDAVCVDDALGKPEQEADPSLLRRVERLPGTTYGMLPQSCCQFPRRVKSRSFLQNSWCGNLVGFLCEHTHRYYVKLSV